MKISLTPRMGQWISEKVGSGLYSSSDEVILEGLRLLMRQEEQRQAMIEDLHKEILVGVRQLDSGNAVVFDQLLVENVKEKGRNRLGL